jgi:hypothetical protein
MFATVRNGSKRTLAIKRQEWVESGHYANGSCSEWVEIWRRASIRNKNRDVSLDIVLLRRVQANKNKRCDCKKDQDEQKLTPTSISTIALWLSHDT